MVSASLSTNENNLQHLGGGNNSSNIISGTKLKKHLNDHDSVGNYISTLVRHHKLSAEQISDFPHNGHSMSTSNTTTTLGLSAISNEPTTPIGNNPTLNSIHSCTSSTSSSNHHYQSMEDDTTSFERGGKHTNQKCPQNKPPYNTKGYQYQNHYEQPTNLRNFINATQTLKGANNDSFHPGTSGQQNVPYLTSSAQLLSEHLRHHPDNMQHSILTYSDVRNQNRIKNMKMHARTNNDNNNDNTRNRWRWLLTRLRKSSTNSQSSSGTSSTSTSSSSANHFHHTAHHQRHSHHNKNHYNNHANNDLFMYHQQDVTAPVSLGGQLHGGIDQTRQSLHEISNFGLTLQNVVHLRPNNFPPNFILNGSKSHHNGRVDDPSSIRPSKSVETDMMVGTSSRLRYHSNQNYHKSQELPFNGDRSFMFPTNHHSPLNGLNQVPENKTEHPSDDNDIFNYRHDVKTYQQQGIGGPLWLQKSHNNHHSGIDNSSMFPRSYQHDLQHANMVKQISETENENAILSSSSESSSDIKNGRTLHKDQSVVKEGEDESVRPGEKENPIHQCNQVSKIDSSLSNEL